MDLRAVFQNNPPNKILSMVLALAAVLLVLWLIVVSGSGTSNPPDVSLSAEEQERLESVRSLRDQAGQMGIEDERADNMKSNVVTTFIVLMVMLAGVWWWSRRGVKHTSYRSSFKQVEQHMLGPGQTLQVMEINDEIWVLGVTGSTINLLHRCDRNEWHPEAELSSVEKPREKPDLGKENTFYSMFKGNS
jgi:flagellar biogenesis protein FliO